MGVDKQIIWLGGLGWVTCGYFKNSEYIEYDIKQTLINIIEDKTKKKCDINEIKSFISDLPKETIKYINERVKW